MLTYELERRGKLSLYEFLYRSIREDILSGTLKAGEKMPSKRGLAEHLGVSVMTVETAYSQLLLEGFLRAEERRGYYVNALEAPPSPLRAEEKSPLAEERREEEPAWFADLKTNRTPAEQFPFSVWASLTRQVLSERSPQLLGPMPGRGLLSLREAIAAYLERFRGVRAAPEQIVVGAGTEYLYGLLVRLLGRNVRFAGEDPGYPKQAQAYRACGAEFCPIPLDGEGISIRELRKQGAGAVHLSPSHQFPTGILTTAARRRELLSWVEEGDRYLIEDDYDSEFRFSGIPIPALQSMDRGGRVIYLNTFSRTLTPAIRVAYLVLPPSLSRQYEQRLGFSSCTVPSFEQLTLAKFLREGKFESHLARTRHAYRKQRDAFLAALRNSPLKGKSRVLQADGGLHFLLEVETAYSDRDLCRRAMDRGILVSCLSDYARLGGTRPHCLVINYSGVERDRIGETVNRLAWAVGE